VLEHCVDVEPRLTTRTPSTAQRTKKGSRSAQHTQG
jgi:hypothetical protein